MKSEVCCMHYLDFVCSLFNQVCQLFSINIASVLILLKFNTAICIQAQTANIFARFLTFETEDLPLETEMYSPLM